MIRIRRETAGDHVSIWHINLQAFGGDAEANLVNQLREGGYVELSLVAESEAELVGHILFSRLPIITESGVFEVVSLAPMAVLPSHQRQGVGSRLIEVGLAEIRRAGHRVVVVLGHPHFYQRFGFSSELAANLDSPFGGGEAWMALELATGALHGVRGRVEYPPPFNAF